MDTLLPLTLAGAGTAALLFGALVIAVGLFVARRQIAVRWHRVFSEPADASRARGDVGEFLAYTTARDLARTSPDLDLRVFPGRLFRPTEVDLLVVARSAVWVIECKAWRGRLVSGADGWLSRSAPRRGVPVQQRRRDPVRQARAQAKAVARCFADAGVNGAPVRDVVVFTDPDADLDAVRDEGFVLYLDEFPSFFRIGPGGTGLPMPPQAREEACRLLERMPAWDFVEFEGGGRRGRITTKKLDIRTDRGRRTIALADVYQASFHLRGWPVVRVTAQVVLRDAGAVLEGTVDDPTARLWIKEQDGEVHPYPLCVVKGFVRGGRSGGKPRGRPTEPHPGNPDGAPAARSV